MIPAGEYGAGNVEIWDGGTWSPEGDPMKGYAEGKLSFTLKGRRLSGRWALVRMGSRARDERGENWLLLAPASSSGKTLMAPGKIRLRAPGKTLRAPGKTRP
jgi:DNA ligase D-like protein (predicted 3'-phosphoesterase)